MIHQQDRTRTQISTHTSKASRIYNRTLIGNVHSCNPYTLSGSSFFPICLLASFFSRSGYSDQVIVNMHIRWRHFFYFCCCLPKVAALCSCKLDTQPTPHRPPESEKNSVPSNARPNKPSHDWICASLAALIVSCDIFDACDAPQGRDFELGHCADARPAGGHFSRVLSSSQRHNHH